MTFPLMPMGLFGRQRSGVAEYRANSGSNSTGNNFTVPEGVYSVLIACQGRGGNANSGSFGSGGGGGCYSTATVSVTPGEILTVDVRTTGNGDYTVVRRGSTTLCSAEGGVDATSSAPGRGGLASVSVGSSTSGQSGTAYAGGSKGGSAGGASTSQGDNFGGYGWYATQSGLGGYSRSQSAPFDQNGANYGGGAGVSNSGDVGTPGGAFAAIAWGPENV